jgi:hypothetical protein
VIATAAATQRRLQRQPPVGTGAVQTSLYQCSPVSAGSAPTHADCWLSCCAHMLPTPQLCLGDAGSHAAGLTQAIARTVIPTAGNTTYLDRTCGCWTVVNCLPHCYAKVVALAGLCQGLLLVATGCWTGLLQLASGGRVVCIYRRTTADCHHGGICMLGTSVSRWVRWLLQQHRQTFAHRQED